MTEIYTALSAVMTDVDHVAKRDINQHQRFNFRGIDAVVNAVGPALRKHKVIVVPTVDAVSYEQVTTSGGKPATACRVRATYTFYAKDGSHIDTAVAAEAWDNGDKAAPKAMSVAFRTALLQALALPTDEPDPDMHTYEREGRPSLPAPEPMTDRTRARMFALFNELGIDEAAQRDGIARVVGHAVESRGSITEQEAQRVIASLEARRKEPTK